jgi:hypothetical protein
MRGGFYSLSFLYFQKVDSIFKFGSNSRNLSWHTYPAIAVPQFSHSIKIEDTAKGIRLSVHVYTNSTGEAIELAFSMYLKAKRTAMDNRITLAPVESK